jgi:hypothetical protein
VRHGHRHRSGPGFHGRARESRVRVEGGTEDEALRPLDFAPEPGRPSWELFAADVIAADLDRVAAEQRDDGGWEVDYLKVSPSGVLDWRGYATVRAVSLLAANGRLRARV